MLLYNRYYPCTAAGERNASPLIILHGLLGSGKNWTTIARELSNYRSVYIFDLRNHGESPHADEFSYDVMAQDVRESCSFLGIERVAVLGHSMGGKLAVYLALSDPGLIEQLLVADIGPEAQEGDLQGLFSALQELPLSELRSRKEADRYLSERIQERRIRLFLLQNLTRKSDGSGGFEWKIGLREIADHLEKVWERSVPAAPSPYPGPVHFIYGESSDYLDRKQRRYAETLFSQVQFHGIPDAGHWLHADNPDAFLQVLGHVLG